jgi:hypothetical protein
MHCSASYAYRPTENKDVASRNVSGGINTENKGVASRNEMQEKFTGLVLIGTVNIASYMVTNSIWKFIFVRDMYLCDSRFAYGWLALMSNLTATEIPAKGMRAAAREYMT